MVQYLNMEDLMFSLKLLSLCAIVGSFTSVYAMEVDKGKVTLEKLEDYNQCQSFDQGGSFCHEALLRWVDKHPGDAFKAGKMTRLKMNHHAAIPFFAKAWQQNKGNCNDEDVKLAVVSALSLPATGNEEIIAQAKQIALDKCTKELGETVASEAKASDYILKNSCRELIAKKLLSGISAKRCTKM